MTKAEGKEAERMFLLFGKMTSGFRWHGQSFYINASQVHMSLASDLAVASHSHSVGDIIYIPGLLLQEFDEKYQKNI